MVALRASEDVLSKYKVITRKDLHSSTAMHNPNLPGLSNAQLSWIWLFSSEGTQAMVGDECKSPICLTDLLHSSYVSSVWRVHWLRARTYAGRWEEEFVMLSSEMR